MKRMISFISIFFTLFCHAQENINREYILEHLQRFDSLSAGEAVILLEKDKEIIKKQLNDIGVLSSPIKNYTESEENYQTAYKIGSC